MFKLTYEEFMKFTNSTSPPKDKMSNFQIKAVPIGLPPGSPLAKKFKGESNMCISAGDSNNSRDSNMSTSSVDSSMSTGSVDSGVSLSSIDSNVSTSSEAPILSTSTKVLNQSITSGVSSMTISSGVPDSSASFGVSSMFTSPGIRNIPSSSGPSGRSTAEASRMPTRPTSLDTSTGTGRPISVGPNSRGGSKNSRGGSKDSRGGSKDSRGGSKNSRGGLKNSRGGASTKRGSTTLRGAPSSRGGSIPSRGGPSSNVGSKTLRGGTRSRNMSGTRGGSSRGSPGTSRGGARDKDGKGKGGRQKSPEPPALIIPVIPPLYPPMPKLTVQNDAFKHLTPMLHRYRKYVRGNFEVKLDTKPTSAFIAERYTDKYTALLKQEERMQHVVDPSLFPEELTTSGLKRIRRRELTDLEIKKKLDLMGDKEKANNEENESDNEDNNEETEPKKRKSDDQDEEDADEANEKTEVESKVDSDEEQEDPDQELDVGNDYIANYFDNGEGNGSDDDIDDPNVY